MRPPAASASNVRPPSWFQRQKARLSRIPGFFKREKSVDIKPRLLHLTGLARVQSVALLYVGALTSILSCVFAAFLGIYKFLWNGTRPGGQSIHEDPSHFGRNFMGKEFPSGKNFYPATLGGMVYDTASDDGKVFMAFSIIGAVCLLASAYPWHLKSVYVRKELWLPGLDMEVPLNLLRQFLPPIGQMLVCCIQLPQSNRLSITWRVAWAVHWIGALMCYGGYLVIEAITIGCFGFDPSNAAKFMTEREIRFRKSLMWTCAISALFFVACSILLKWPLSAASCGLACSCNHAPWIQKCTDVWVMPTMQNVTDALNDNRYLSAHRMLVAIDQRRDMLVNTASGWILGVKQFNYTMELTCMLSVYLSQMVIWFFSQERKVDLDEDMPTLTLNIDE